VFVEAIGEEIGLAVGDKLGVVVELDLLDALREQ
jgi:hypothetical protein